MPIAKVATEAVTHVPLKTAMSQSRVRPPAAIASKPAKVAAKYRMPLRERIILRILTTFFSYSTNPEVAQIERDLAKEGVWARFVNQLDVAKKTQKVLCEIKNAGLELPKIFLLDTSSKKLSTLGRCRRYLGNDSEKNMVRLRPWILTGKHKEGWFSTDNEAHIIYHEIGHWLHFRNITDLEALKPIWATAKKELVKTEVSEYALNTDTGTDFVAEVFAGLMAGKKYSEHIMDIYQKLRGPMPNFVEGASSLSLVA